MPRTEAPGGLKPMGLQESRTRLCDSTITRQQRVRQNIVCVCACVLSHVQLFVTPWTVAHQAPLSMGFSRQEYWSGLPCPLPGDLLDPGIKPDFLTSPAWAGGSFTTGTTCKTQGRILGCSKNHDVEKGLPQNLNID